jgi:hypothetical protein
MKLCRCGLPIDTDRQQRFIISVKLKGFTLQLASEPRCNKCLRNMLREATKKLRGFTRSMPKVSTNPRRERSEKRNLWRKSWKGLQHQVDLR